jgi:ABC-type amino acid transport substrate-binding protein
MERAGGGEYWTGRAAIVIAAVVLAAVPRPSTQEAPRSDTLTRIRESGRIALGYRADARPFSYENESGQAAGYTVAVCQRVAEAIRSALQLETLTVDFVPVSADERFRTLQEGRVDLLCGADTVTLARRGEVAFSVPVFPGGIGALVRADAPARLREVLAGHGQPFRPTWRAAATQILQARAFAAVKGTTADRWLSDRFDELHIVADVATVPSYEAGIQNVLDHQADVFVGERAILLDAAKRHASARDLVVVDRLFSYEPLALALARGDEDFRLAVDRAIGRLYRSGALDGLYTSTFGEPDENAITFFRWTMLPE